MKDIVFKILVIWLILSGFVLNIILLLSTIHIYVIGN